MTFKIPAEPTKHFSEGSGEMLGRDDVFEYHLDASSIETRRNSSVIKCVSRASLECESISELDRDVDRSRLAKRREGASIISRLEISNREEM